VSSPFPRTLPNPLLQHAHWLIFGVADATLKVNVNLYKCPPSPRKFTRHSLSCLLRWRRNIADLGLEWVSFSYICQTSLSLPSMRSSSASISIAVSLASSSAALPGSLRHLLLKKTVTTFGQFFWFLEFISHFLGTLVPLWRKDPEDSSSEHGVIPRSLKLVGKGDRAVIFGLQSGTMCVHFVLSYISMPWLYFQDIAWCKQRSGSLVKDVGIKRVRDIALPMTYLHDAVVRPVSASLLNCSRFVLFLVVSATVH